MRQTAKWAAFCVVAIVGLILCSASPGMLLVGAWGGSDGGSVARGLLIAFVMPWALYLASSAGVVALSTRGRQLGALAPGRLSDCPGRLGRPCVRIVGQDNGDRRVDGPGGHHEADRQEI